MLYGQERRVVGAADIDRGPARLARVVAEQLSALPVQFLSLRRREEFLVREPGGALQGRVEFVGPNSLQIGFAPRCFKGRAGSGRSLSRDLGDRR